MAVEVILIGLVKRVWGVALAGRPLISLLRCFEWWAPFGSLRAIGSLCRHAIDLLTAIVADRVGCADPLSMVQPRTPTIPFPFVQCHSIADSAADGRWRSNHVCASDRRTNQFDQSFGKRPRKLDNHLQLTLGAFGVDGGVECDEDMGCSIRKVKRGADGSKKTIKHRHIDFTLSICWHLILQLFGNVITDDRREVPTIHKNPGTLMSLKQKSGAEVHISTECANAV